MFAPITMLSYIWRSNITMGMLLPALHNCRKSGTIKRDQHKCENCHSTFIKRNIIKKHTKKTHYKHNTQTFTSSWLKNISELVSPTCGESAPHWTIPNNITTRKLRNDEYLCLQTRCIQLPVRKVWWKQSNFFLWWMTFQFLSLEWATKMI